MEDRKNILEKVFVENSMNNFCFKLKKKNSSVFDLFGRDKSHFYYILLYNEVVNKNSSGV